MQALSDAVLLATWEQGRSLPPVERSLRLLAAAFPPTAQPVAAWPLGRRDRHLLDLRAAHFGPQLSSVTNCPACSNILEFEFGVDNIRLPEDSAPEDSAPEDGGPEDDFTVEETDGVYHLRLRPVNSADLLAVAVDPHPAALLARCTLAAHHNGAIIDASTLPDAVVVAAAARLAELDPQANIQLALRCVHCNHAWQATFDIGAYLWQEIDAWAQRTLREVHLLASAYGWHEAEILSLSAARRRAYLELVMG